MAAVSPNEADCCLELEVEKRRLQKAETDIERGSTRLRNQQHLLETLQASGHDTVHAERLMLLFRQTLAEWEHHRNLIEQRIEHLKQRARAGGQADPP